MLEALKMFHQAGYVHNDVKPSNFLVKEGRTFQEAEVYLIDLGLVEEFDEFGENKTQS